MTAYSVDLPTHSKLTLRVAHQPRDCASILAQLKDGALSGKDRIDVASVKDVSIDGYSGIEYQARIIPTMMTSQRFYCADGRFYTFSIGWPANEDRSAAADRAINSFRLLKHEQK